MKRFIIYILSLWFALACARFDDEISSTSITLGDEVAITLSVGVNGITGESEEELPSITVRSEESTVLEESTVSFTNDISDDNDAVMNLWVVQFDGTSDESKIVSMSYIDEGNDLVGTQPTVNFVETSAATTILFLANTFDDELIPSLGCTLAEVKALNYSVATNLEDVDVTSSNQLSYANGLLVENEGEKYFTMSCAIECQIPMTGDEESDILNIKLLRNAVKLTFIMKNLWEGAEITSISLRDASQMCYYYSSYLADSSYDSNANPFPTSTSPVDYQTTTLSITENQSQTITFYAPANLKGVEPLSTLESKSYYAPATSTYIYIEALYNGAQTYTYTYYLGENLFDNYDLLPNHAYIYTLTFNEGGSADTDYTVETSEIDYTLRESSNCYILNPSNQDDVVYYIPIEPRINEFWGSYAQHTEAPRFKDEIDWDFAVLWYDNDESPICTAVWENDVDVSEPTTNEVKIERVDKRNDVAALKVTLPKDFDNYGNMVVAVYDKDGTITKTNGDKSAIDGDILWSWHFWITDYNPDSRQHTPIDGYYRYSVDGGEIHRYIDNTLPDNLDADDIDTFIADAQETTTYYNVLWGDGGVYENSFIMDRNLGARGTSYVDQGAGTTGTTAGESRYYIPGALYYQAGRKDPFIANIGNFITGTDSDGNYTYGYIQFDNSSGDYPRRESCTLTSEDNYKCPYKFEDAVLRPTVFFYSTSNSSKNNWTNESAANTVDFLWNDKYIPNAANTYLVPLNKSIFDPSPLGWRMPIRGTWDNFNSDVDEINPTDTYAYIDGSSKLSREYLLCGAIYPGSSGIQISTDFFKKSYLETLSWSATPYDRSGEDEYVSVSFYSSYLGAYDAGVFPQGKSWHYRQIGMPVRPVKCQ